MMKQPIHTKDYLLLLNMHFNLKNWAENKIIVTGEAIKQPDYSFAFDQTAVMCFYIEHGK
jgi:hypothetical protein